MHLLASTLMEADDIGRDTIGLPDIPSLTCKHSRVLSLRQLLTDIVNVF